MSMKRETADIKTVLAAAIEEAITLCIPEGFDGTLALRRIEQAGYKIVSARSIVPAEFTIVAGGAPQAPGEIRVAANNLSESFMLAEASALGTNVVYFDEDLDRMGFVPGNEFELTPEGERVVQAVAEGDYTKVADQDLRTWGEVIGQAIAQPQRDPGDENDRAPEKKPSVHDVLLSVACMAPLLEEHQILGLIKAAEQDIRSALAA